MGFEKFGKSKAVLGRTPNVTIQARGIISINKAAYVRIGSPEFVDLLYDEDEELIGIRPAEDPKDGHRVRVAGQQGASAVVSGTAFTNYYGIPNKESLRWEPSFDGDMLVIDLKAPGRPIGSRRTRQEGDDADED
jgi:hypothetical protein